MDESLSSNDYGQDFASSISSFFDILSGDKACARRSVSGTYCLGDERRFMAAICSLTRQPKLQLRRLTSTGGMLIVHTVNGGETRFNETLIY